MGDENPIRTLGDYFKPSHEGYRNTIELPVGNNMVPLQSDTIRLVQNRCSFHRLRSEDSIQYLKDFLRIVDSIDLNGDTRITTRLRLFDFSLHDQAIIWLDRERLRELRQEVAWETIEDLAQYEEEGWKDPIVLEEENID
nr:MAK10-like protein [Tanacetum cinerariifolium]